MKVYNSLNNLPKWNFPVITQGTFDGVHTGHRKLIDEINFMAKKHGGESVLLTYHPHPRLVLNPNDSTLKLLNTLEEKMVLLEETGIQNVILLNFDEKMASMNPSNFIDEVLIEKINAKMLVVGYDHRFGRNRKGSLTDLKNCEKEGKFKVKEISPQEIKDIIISSTKIRNALFEGKIHSANTLLGSNYVINGRVVKGKQLGRELGFPTANLDLENINKLIPKDGVYKVTCEVGGKVFDGMLSIGSSLTLNEKEKKLEVHILGFNGDIYGQMVKVEFIKWIRDNKKFANLQLLKEQIERDREFILGRG